MNRLRFSLRSGRPAAAALLSVSLCFGGLTGCKTQDDAVAAASQMATTAATLSSYYRSLDLVLAHNEDAFQAQAILYPGTRVVSLKDVRAEIAHREDLADAVGNLASLFGKLTGSSAADDASNAAGKLNAELVTVHALNSNDKEAQAVTEAVKLVVSLLQQHDEVKAARELSPLCHALTVFFSSEQNRYNQLDQAFLSIARSVANGLVDKNQVGVDQIFVSSLQPFDLQPNVSAVSMQTDARAYLRAKIGSEYDQRLAEAKKATAAMGEALAEMDTRIALVATDKPMKIRIPPFSLSTVETWVNHLS